MGFDMKRLMLIIFLLGVVATTGVGEDDLPPAPVRLANGMPVEGMIQETNAEGLVILTLKGVAAYPWKYLSAGTRYRHERPFLAAQAIARSNALRKAKAQAVAAAKAKAAAKAAASASAKTNVKAKAVSTNAVTGQAASTNVATQAGAKDITTNAPAKSSDPAKKKKKSRTSR